MIPPFTLWVEDRSLARRHPLAFIARGAFAYASFFVLFWVCMQVAAPGSITPADGRTIFIAFTAGLLSALWRCVLGRRGPPFPVRPTRDAREP